MKLYSGYSKEREREREREGGGRGRVNYEGSLKTFLTSTLYFSPFLYILKYLAVFKSESWSTVGRCNRVYLSLFKLSRFNNCKTNSVLKRKTG